MMEEGSFGAGSIILDFVNQMIKSFQFNSISVKMFH